MFYILSPVSCGKLDFPAESGESMQSVTYVHVLLVQF